MTESQTEQIIKLLEENQKGQIYSIVGTCCMFVAIVLFCIFAYIDYKERKKQIAEWKTTLNKEQLEVITKYEKINK